MKRTILLAALILTVTSGAFAQRGRAIRLDRPPTFSEEIVRIFQRSCQSCHREGDVAPFPLMTYDDAVRRASMIHAMTTLRKMPPWKVVSGCGSFDAERKLSDAEISLIARWAQAGAPEGDRSRLPEPVEFEAGWVFGQPDLVLSNAEPYTPPVTGDMYRCFPLPPNGSSDQYVSAIDLQPGDRETVHHVIAYVDTTGESVALDATEPGPGYRCFGGPGFATTSILGAWAPGARPFFVRDGVAMLLPKNSRIVLQVHYHPHDDGPLPDRTEIGIYYAGKPVQKILRVLPIVNDQFVIPAGNSDFEVRAALTIPSFIPAHAEWIAPHMHLLGRKMKVEAIRPGGSRECLVEVDDWDFNWQGMYTYKEPVALPGGTRIEMTARYDNSADNPRNPNIPPKPVGWGEETTDEMALAFIGYTLDAENLLTAGKAANR